MQDFEKLGAFYLGRPFDLQQKNPKEGLLLYDSKDLVTHAVCVGMTGSGKTGLCIALLEEAAIDSIPAIIIDPKGDLGNLLLTFPNLAPEGLVVLPSAVLHKMVEAVMPRGRLGVFSPLPEQTALIAGKWQRDGVDVVGDTLQPGSDDAIVDATAREMAAKAPDLIVLDCMSYTSANKARVRRHYAGPVILSIAAAARVIEELVS